MNTIGKRLRDVWYDFRSEVGFGIVTVAALVIGYWASSRYISAELSEKILWPALNICLAEAALFGAVLCLKHHEHNKIRIAWAVMLLIWTALEIALIVGVAAFDNPIANPGTEKLTSETMLIGGLFGWILCIYPIKALSPKRLSWSHLIFLLVPLAILAVLNYTLDVDLRILIGCYPVWLLVVLLGEIKRYRRWCEDTFSSMEQVDVQWFVRYFIMLLIAGFSFLWLCFSSDPSRGITQDIYLLFMICYTTDKVLYRPDPWTLIRSTAPVQEVEQEEPCPAAEEEPATLTDNEKQVYRRKVDEWMRQEKPYHNPDFQLIDLRQVVPLNRSYLSRMIHTEYGCSFYQFVTQYRLEEAKQLMSDHPEMKITDVAAQCGFSSRRVFTQTFTREEGITPSEWIAGKH